VISALPTASSLFFPFGDKYKKGVRRPFLCLSCADFDAEIARLASPKVQANSKVPEVDDAEEVAYDITKKVLSMAGCPPQYKTNSFCEAFAEAGGSVILQLFGQIINQQGYEEPERPDLGPHYEVQVRDLQAKQFKIVLRTQRKQQLPEGWDDLPQVSLLPDEFVTGTGTIATESKKAQ